MDQRQISFPQGPHRAPSYSKNEFRAPKRSVSQASAAAGSSSRWDTVQIEPFQDTSRPGSTCDPSDISHLDTHTPTSRSCAVSVMSSLA